MKIGKKILALLLAVAVMVPVIGMTSFAEDSVSPGQTDVNKSTIVGPEYSYSGKYKKPTSSSFGVYINGEKLKTSEYTIKVISGNVKEKKAGKYTITVVITGKGVYTGQKIVKNIEWYIRKSQSLKASVPSKLKVKNVAKKEYNYTIKVYGGAKVTWASSNSAYVSVVNGQIHVAKGTPKGTYYVKLYASQTDEYKGLTKTYKIVVK